MSPLGVSAAGSRRSPVIFSVVVGLAAVAVLPWAAHSVGPHLGFFPAVVGLICCFDVLSAYLLVHQFRTTGDMRPLAMAGAYTWSLVAMLGCAGAFPDLVGPHPPLATAPSISPWLYVCWHTGFPVLLGVAWAPWPRRLPRTCAPERRRRLIRASQLACGGAALVLVATVVALGPRMPVLINGESLHRLTTLTAPFSLPLVALSGVVAAVGLRGRGGPERWTSAAVLVCLVDLCLTYFSGARFSVGWYAGRTLSVVAAAVVLIAMIRELTHLRATLAATLTREREVELDRDRRELVLRAVIANSQSLIYAKDLQGRYLLVNRAFEEAFSILEADLLGRDNTSLDAELAPLWSANDLAAQQGECRLEEWSEGPDGRRFYDSVKFPLLDSDGRVYATCGIALDVTDARFASAQLVRARDDALAAANAKSAFLATMSHEIRTPMNAVIGMTGALLDTDMNAEQREFVEIVRDSGDGLLTIINDVLDFSKIESGELELEEYPFELRDCVESALGLVALTAANKGLELVADLDASCPEMLLGDATRFRQIIVNLLSNAVKFTADGEVVVSVRSRDLGVGVVRITVSVADTGIGIPADRMHRLFQSFSQVDSSTTRVYGGTGLGLAISRRLAEAMGGDLQVVSEPAIGSTFTFTAVVKLSTDRRRAPTGPDDHPGASLVGTTALVVGENATNRRVLRALLENWGMSCWDVGGAAAATALVATGRRFDVAVLDIRRPEIEGPHLARALRELPTGRRLPLILFTNLQRRLIGGDRALFAATLTKPVRNVALRERLSGAVAPARALVHAVETSGGLRRDDGPAPSTDDQPLRVLLAEDNRVNQKVAQLMLAKFGHRVDTVGSGLEAVEAVRRVRYDVVLMDVQMPELDGVAATRMIRTELAAEDQPAIVGLTASALAEDRAAGTEAGMDAYLTKPIRALELNNVLVAVRNERAAAALMSATAPLSARPHS